MSNVKKFNAFNESNTGDIIITMDDIRKMKHNLSAGGMDFLSNYGWSEDTTLIAMLAYSKPQVWDNTEVMIYDLYKNGKYKSEIGYAISIDGEIKYLLGIYEPHGCSINAKRGVVTAHGHEQIIKVWLDDGEFEETYIR